MKTPSTDPRLPLILLVGPTAVGKTALAIELATQLDGEIVSADSRLFYRGMDIGTAKPTPEERRRVAHHLIDVADPDEVWSLALFQRAAERAIAQIHRRGRLPFLVGGSGQYVRAVTENWQPPAIRPDPALRTALERWSEQVGSTGLHQRLGKLDAAAAQSIDPRNVRRTIRALEVIFSSGQRFSSQRGSGEARYATLQIGLHRPRAELYARIDRRIEQMLASGLLEEVRGLLANGYSPELPTLSAIGYREMAAHLRGEISQQEAIVLVKRRTRAFVRRQANWFKPQDPAIHWFEMSQTTSEEMAAFIRRWLAEIPWGVQDSPKS